MPDQPIYPPGTPDALLVKLTRMPADSLRHLADAIRSEDAFTRDEARARAIAERTGLSAGDATAVLVLLGNIYSYLYSSGDLEETLESALTELLDGFDHLGKNSADRTEVVAVLLPLLERNPHADQRLKLQRLAKGFLPNAIAFASFVDLRPSFNTDLTDIAEFVPVVQFRVTTDALAAKDRQIVLQLNRESVTAMKDAIDRLQKKITALESTRTLNRKISGS